MPCLNMTSIVHAELLQTDNPGRTSQATSNRVSSRAHTATLCISSNLATKRSLLTLATQAAAYDPLPNHTRLPTVSKERMHHFRETLAKLEGRDINDKTKVFEDPIILRCQNNRPRPSAGSCTNWHGLRRMLYVSSHVEQN